ncbi:serine hydrolase FSH [Phycomyces nitens]|nr:serine hydrolase FSH [Phycomyces nitens]
MEQKKLRILCLHGYAHNATIFEKKCAKFTKGLDQTVEFVYKSGPHIALTPEYTTVSERSQEQTEVSAEIEPHAWWYAVTYYPVIGQYCIGFEKSIEYIKQVLLEEGPFDGVMGFSQGAAFGVLLQYMLENTVFPDMIPADFGHPPFRFVISIAGFLDTHNGHIEHVFKTPKLKTPSLHVIGDADTIIVPERMIALSQKFEKATLLKHPGS